MKKILLLFSLFLCLLGQLSGQILPRFLVDSSITENTSSNSFDNPNSFFNHNHLNASLRDFSTELKTITRFFNLNPQFTLGGREEFIFDQSGHKFVNTRQSWTSVTELWINTTRREYFFDQNERVSEVIDFQWNFELENWFLSERFDYAYSQDSLAVERIGYSRDTTLQAWNFFEKYLFNLDQEGNIITDTTFNWDQDLQDWIFYERSIRMYNSFGNLIDLESFDSNNQISDKREVFYNSAGLISEELNYHDNAGSFQLENRITYIYEDDTKLIEQLTEIIDDSNNFSNSQRILINSDDQGNRISSERYLWDSDNMTWFLDDFNNREYDFSTLFDEIRLPITSSISSINEDLFHHKIQSEIRSSIDLDGNQFDELETYYEYNDLPINSIDLTTANHKLYPNPVFDKFKIEFEEGTSETSFHLFDQHGRQVRQQVIGNVDVINISELPAGVYYYQLLNNQKNELGKIVKY